MDVSRETSSLLSHYAQLVRKWSPTINLVAPSQIDELEERHIADSLQLADLIPMRATTIIDLGSGGGFPGLVLAIHAAVHHPERNVTLIESDQRKAVFLRTVVRELDLPARVICSRIENAEISPADVVTARALAPLTALLSYAKPLLQSDGTALFPKGEAAEKELADARHAWSFACQEVPSKTRTNARILVIKDIRREPAS